MERTLPLQQIGRLGVCKQTTPWSEANWGQAILRKYIRPAAQKVGIRKQFGWHTFRHTYSTLLRSVGTEFKVMQELLRHSSFRSTSDVYTQAISPAKHAAQAAVLALVFTAETNTTGLTQTRPVSATAAQ
jgi:integrase